MQQSDQAVGGNSFETSLKEIERIVAELEKGERPLEAQFKAFEQGISLSKNCLRQLEEVERRVEILVSDANGQPKTVPFDPS